MPRFSLEQLGKPIEAQDEKFSPDLIEGILPDRDLLLITGDTNIGKSLVCLEMVAALLNGQPLWGSVPVRPIKKAAYVLGEHNPKKLRDLWRLTQMQVPQESLWLVGTDKLTERAVITNGYQRADVVAQLRTLVTGVDVVVFDPLGAFVLGADAENDNATMRAVIQTLSDITQSAGASCIIPAHGGKATLSPEGKETKRATYMTRGASAIEDAATNIFYMHDEGGRVYNLKRRKFKGTDTPENYRLHRDEATKTHRLLESKKYRNEVEQIGFERKLGRLMQAYPSLAKTDAVEMLATAEGISRSTAFRWLEGERGELS